MRRKLEAVLAAVIPHGELLVACDYGAIRGENAGLGSSQLYAHVTRKPRDHVAIGITSRSVVFVPIRLVGVFRTKLDPRRDEPLEILPRTDVIVELGTVDELGGRRAVPVRFVRRDGSARLVELYDDSDQWSSLSR